MRLYTMKEVMDKLNVTRMTLLSWEQKDKIHSVRTPDGRRRYREDEINLLLGIQPDDTVNRVFVYYRVSTRKQLDAGNLQRQKERLLGYCYDKGYQVEKAFC